MEQATHSGPRAQKTPPPGIEGSIGLRRSASDSLPNLALPSLAGSPGEVVDSSSLLYLCRCLEAEEGGGGGEGEGGEEEA